MTQADLPAELPFNDSPSGKAWSTQEIIVVNDVANDRRWPTVMKKIPAAGIETYCSVPLTAGEPLERVAAVVNNIARSTDKLPPQSEKFPKQRQAAGWRS